MGSREWPMRARRARPDARQRSGRVVAETRRHGRSPWTPRPPRPPHPGRTAATRLPLHCRRDHHLQVCGRPPPPRPRPPPPVPRPRTVSPAGRRRSVAGRQVCPGDRVCQCAAGSAGPRDRSPVGGAFGRGRSGLPVRGRSGLPWATRSPRRRFPPPAFLPIAAQLVGEAPAFLVARHLESIARIRCSPPGRQPVRAADGSADGPRPPPVLPQATATIVRARTRTWPHRDVSPAAV